MKNNKFNKEWMPLGLVLFIITIMVIAFNQPSKFYKTIYNRCENEPVLEITDCRCVARCMEKIYKKYMFLETDMTEMCIIKCL